MDLFGVLLGLLESNPEILAWGIGLLTSVMLICRGLAELLLLFADKTTTTIDNKILAFAQKAAEICAKILGWFGVGYPKSLKELKSKKNKKSEE